MKHTLPSKMKAVFQESKGSELVIKEINLPVPGKGEVLVKMKYAPVNPSDLSQLRGTMTPLPLYPFIPGIEGSGTVVSAGKGIIPALRSGKYVACSPKGKGGTWSEYMVTDATKCIPLNRNISLEIGSMLIVNPMTALALIDIAKKGKYNTIVNNAAASSLGLMLADLCKTHRINLINIVRNSKQQELLTKHGAGIILNSSEKDFIRDFRKLSIEHKCRLIFDAVGGEQTGMLIRESPVNSRIILYANLSDDSFSADTRDILQFGKVVEGFSLPLWLGEKSIIQLMRHTAKVKSFIASGNHLKVRSKFDITEVNEALKHYKANMTGGKLLLKL